MCKCVLGTLFNEVFDPKVKNIHNSAFRTPHSAFHNVQQFRKVRAGNTLCKTNTCFYPLFNHKGIVLGSWFSVLNYESNRKSYIIIIKIHDTPRPYGINVHPVRMRLVDPWHSASLMWSVDLYSGMAVAMESKLCKEFAVRKLSQLRIGNSKKELTKLFDLKSKSLRNSAFCILHFALHELARVYPLCSHRGGREITAKQCIM